MLGQTEKSMVRQLDVGKWVSQQNDKQKCNSTYNTITVLMHGVKNKKQQQQKKTKKQEPALGHKWWESLWTKLTNVLSR